LRRTIQETQLKSHSSQPHSPQHTTYRTRSRFISYGHLSWFTVHSTQSTEQDSRCISYGHLSQLAVRSRTARSSRCMVYDAQFTARTLRCTVHSTRSTEHDSSLTAHSEGSTAHSLQNRIHDASLTGIANSSQLAAHGLRRAVHSERSKVARSTGYSQRPALYTKPAATREGDFLSQPSCRA
jgi:hypothetical protein